MISLVGAEVQYVIAEATRTLSLQSDDVHDSEDELWLGCQTIPRSEGLCADAVKNFTEKYDEAPSYFIVNDLAKHDQYKDQYFVAGKPHNRFYAGVPIRTSAGYVIGAYSVVDDKPRGGLNQVEATFLKDMAMTVMGHLELTRVEHQHHRAEKMLKGIGLFVEGKSSLREWWLKTGHLIRGSEAKSDDQGVGSLSEQADGLFGVDRNELESRPSSGIEGMKSSSEPPDKPERDLVSRRHSTTSTVELKDSEAISSMGQESGMSTKADASPLDTASAESPDNVTASRLQDSLISRDVVEMFSRASSLIREAIGVDGAIFLDASVGAFGGGTDRAGMSENISTAFKLGGIQWNSSSSEDERQKSASEGTHGEAEVYLSTNHAPAEPCSLGLTPSKREKMCGILGYSTKIRAGQYTNEDLKVKHSFPERFLRKLLKRYPLGKIFNFEDDGSTSSSEGEHCQAPRKDYTPMVDTQSDVVTEARQRLTRKMSYESEAKSLRQMLPGVRSAAMFPLWDAHKERWFAGSLVWTTSSTRALDPIEDLTYLAAFGNSIMAEVARLNALIADQMKADFISSISHELRSPLHGVLAGVEFLQDSPLDPQQEDMVSTINACGRTLLDTIDHVLDFTKTNSFLKPKRNDKRRKKNGRRFRGASPEKETLRTNAPDDYSNDHSQIDLGVLTEEVIDSILAGRVYGDASSSSSSLFHSTSEWTEPDSKRSKGTRAVSVSKDWVMVIVDIDWRSSWMFKAHPGAWRRILMNLFGNALKYTSAGFVRVSLSCRDTTSAPGQVTKSVIYLSVVDSGKGISKEFLRHQLYTPFVQENPLATGTGLGLSIVRQIVDAYGGVIEFNSEQGSGTEVKISLTLDNAMPSASLLADSSETVITKVRKTTRGLKACLVAFDVYPNIVGTQTGRPSVEAERMLSLRSSLASHLTNWFEMEVTFSPALNSSSGDIAIAMESEVISSILQGADDVIAESKEYLPGTSEGSPLIVLRATASPSPRPISNNNQVLVYVQEP
jgi:signal transduction histidine kinase